MNDPSSISFSDDGNSVVRVRAQVMMRDDSTGGWVPMGGGGLSNVSVRKRKIHHEDDQPCKHEYLIYGKRISDQSMEMDEVVLSCTIKKDFEYNKVMPTFHHWKTGNKKFGLTFQTAAEARAFDKGVRLAIEDLLDAKSLACPHKHYRESKKKGVSDTSPLHQYNIDVGEDDVFLEVDIPVEKSESIRSPPLRSPTSPPHKTPSPGGVETPSGGSSSGTWSNERKLLLPAEKIDILAASELDKDYSYVKFPARPRQCEPPHEYSYPKLVDTYGDSTSGKRGSISSLKKHNFEFPSPHLPLKKGVGGSDGPQKGGVAFGGVAKRKKGPTATCAHCRESFSLESNTRGSCHYAPDCVRKGIETVTCLQCAKCLLYHCMSDSEGDYVHPCECSNSDGHWARRWIGLTFLSILVPCLCCYAPLMACYKCGTLCSICGGKHQPQS